MVSGAETANPPLPPPPPNDCAYMAEELAPVVVIDPRLETLTFPPVPALAPLPPIASVAFTFVEGLSGSPDHAVALPAKL